VYNRYVLYGKQLMTVIAFWKICVINNIRMGYMSVSNI